MWNPSRIADNAGSIYENFVVTLPSNEDNFAILSFNNLDLCSSPCLADNLMFSCPKLSQKVQNMDQDLPVGKGKTAKQPVPDQEERFSHGSAEAQLSPGVEFADCETFLQDPGNPTEFLNLDEVGLFLSGGLNDSEDLSAEFDVIGSLSTVETTGIDASWLTNTTVTSPDQLKFTGSEFSEGGFFTAVPAAFKTEKVLQEISIPSTVQDSIVCDTEEALDTSLAVTGSSTQPSSSSRGRKRRRQSVAPGSEEYQKKRELNNISVRKSREKARQKHQVIEERVGVLSGENSRLQERVDSLEKELTILRGLFTNIGAALPGEVTKFMSAE